MTSDLTRTIVEIITETAYHQRSSWPFAEQPFQDACALGHLGAPELSRSLIAVTARPAKESSAGDRQPTPNKVLHRVTSVKRDERTIPTKAPMPESLKKIPITDPRGGKLNGWGSTTLALRTLLRKPANRVLTTRQCRSKPGQWDVNCKKPRVYKNRDYERRKKIRKKRRGPPKRPPSAPV